MKRNLIALSMLLFLCHTLIAADRESGCTAKVRSVNVSIPAPAEGFVEVGSEKRDYFEQSDATRLLCAFVAASDLPHLWKPARGMDRYMLVRTSRRLEDRDISQAEFEQLVAVIVPQLSAAASRIAKSKEEELKRDAKALHRPEDMSVSDPVLLGTFQSKDTYGFGMVVSGPVFWGVNKKYVDETVLLRLNKRLAFLYVFAVYQDETTVTWAKDVAEKWARHILDSNPE